MVKRSSGRVRTATSLKLQATSSRHRAALVFGLSLCLSFSAAGFFDLGRVNEVRLTFAEPNWDEILDSLYAAGEEGRLLGAAVINGQEFDSVGVRYKGYSSYNPGRKKNPLNIKLDEVHVGRELEGHGTLRLANVYKDPSFVREVLSYEIARMFMPAGRASFASVFINDTLIGLYTNDEDPDRLFMRRFYYCDENPRFKARVKFDSVAMMGWKYLGPDSAPYLDFFELESDTGWRQLIAMLDTLSNHNSALDRVVNTDQLLWMLAFDVLFVNLDSPINTPQNHYLYRDASGRFCPSVWDLNESFGAYRDLEGVGQLSLAQMQQLDPFLRSTDPDYPISSMVLNDARRKRMYVAHSKTMIADVLADNWYRDRAYEIQDGIDSFVQADRNKFYTYNDFHNNVTRSVGSGPLAIVGLTELMNQRMTFVLSRPDFQAAAPVITDVSGSPYPARPNSDVQFLARVADADSVWLGFREDPARRFVSNVMYDDGRHGDGAASDGIYGVSLPVAAGDGQYYVYAENSAAGSFSPARAEHEYFTVPVAADVVLNEFEAINVSTVQDPSGQFDDWIELRNNTGAILSLDGWFLTNDSTDKTRWQFPDVIIPSNRYLVVWADRDTTQPGLHADFELSGSSGMLLLSDPDGHPIDRVTYGPQTADVSFGRYPNGIGAFRLMNPTFAAANDSTVGIGESPSANLQSADLGLRSFPNPLRRTANISYALRAPARVTLQVFDRSGRLVARLLDAEQGIGEHTAAFPATGPAPASGVYFVRLRVSPTSGSDLTQTLKLTKVSRQRQ